MNKTYLFLILVVMTFSSCRTPYDPDVEADQSILVVDALLTNHSGGSYVYLFLARPFDLDGSPPPVRQAIVYLTDNSNNRINFQEISKGYYQPVDTLFAGEINSSYELTVITPDGCIYRSKPETIHEDMTPSRVYGGFDQVEYLTKDAYGKTIMITENVCALYFDYEGGTEVPHFRYNSSQLIEYFLPIGTDVFYCWKSEADYNLRFTYQRYASSSPNIYKQEVSTLPPDILMSVSGVFTGTTSSGATLSASFSDKEVYEHKRIVEIKQYRLNDDSYKYYNQVKAQSDAEGKLFDPIITQIKGNISCINIPSKTVLGFFEASNCITMSYAVRRYGVGYPVAISQVDNAAPHPWSGHLLNQKPDFWIP